MNKWKFTLLCILTVFLQNSVMPRLAFFGAAPNLILVFLIVLSVQYGEKWGGYTGLALGLIEDLLFSTVLGVRALCLYVIGYLVGRIFRASVHPFWTGLIALFIATPFYDSVLWLFQYSMGIRFLPVWYVKSTLLIELGMHIVLYVLVFWLLRSLLKPQKIRKYTGLR